MQKNRLFFLSSFLPAIGYWYLEAYYPLKVAVIGGVILAVIEIILEKIFTKHVHSLSKMNFLLMMALGAISLLEDQGKWFKLTPMFTGILIGAIFLFKKLKGVGFLEEMIVEMRDVKIPKEIWGNFEIHFSLFMIGYGSFMGLVALKFNTNLWLFFKTAGFYIATALFMAIEMIYMRIKIKRWQKYQLTKDIISKF
ncbi:MAG: septation protein IspZ [Bacteriovoracaceae bacterium]